MRILILGFMLLLGLSLPTIGKATEAACTPATGFTEVLSDGENDPPVQPKPKSKREKAEAKKKKKQDS